jgi:hypothetical protein
MTMMDEMNTMETMDTVDTEAVEPEVVEDDYDVDVVDTEAGNHGMLKTTAKAVIGLGVAVGGFFGIRKCVKKRREKYITQTPKGLIRCK